MRGKRWSRRKRTSGPQWHKALTVFPPISKYFIMEIAGGLTKSCPHFYGFAELQVLIAPGIINRPERRPLSVGVPGFGKLHPVAVDQFCQGKPYFIRGKGALIQVVKHIWDFRPVKGAQGLSQRTLGLHGEMI